MTPGKVEALSYQMIVVDDRHDFDKAGPWTGTIGDFDGELRANQLALTPRSTFHTAEEARDSVEPFLRAWELDSELAGGLQIEFRFSSARVDQTKGGNASTTVMVHTVDALLISEGVTAHISHGNYPAPPASGLKRTQFVDDLLIRVRELRTRSHPMLVVAYLFLTQLEYEHGGRQQAARQLNVEVKILQSLGRLSAKNDPQERRKVKGAIDPLTEPERQWLFAALPKLTWQAAHVESGKMPARLGMNDLPSSRPTGHRSGLHSPGYRHHIVPLICGRSDITSFRS
ncbi:MAG: hypothetical protein ACRDKB_12140 [Actinomycetota bacterium]